MFTDNDATQTGTTPGYSIDVITITVDYTVTCTPAAAPTIGGTLSGNPAGLCSVVTDGANTSTNYTVFEGSPPDDNFDDNSLDAKWTKWDVGPDTGTVSETGQQLSLAGGGGDIWNNADEFTYLYQSGISGDFSIQVQVISQQNTFAWAKAGLMVREQLTAGSKDAYMVTTPGNGARWQYRDVTNGAAQNPSIDQGGSSTAPVWLRITRIGDTFTGDFSTDGSTWTNSGSNTVVMTDPVYIGLANTSHQAGTLSAAVFDDFVTTGLAVYDGATCNSVSTTGWANGSKSVVLTYTDNCSTPNNTTTGTFTFSADTTPPTVSGSIAVTPLSSGTTAGSFTATQDFADAESAVTSCQYTLNGGGSWSAGVVSGSGPYTCTANVSGQSDGASLSLQFHATSGGGQSADSGALALAVDAASPSTSISVAGTTAGTPVAFTVTFNESVSGFTNSDVTLGGTAGATTAVVSGGPAVYTVNVSGMTGSGTITMDINAGVAGDAVGNSNTAATQASTNWSSCPTTISLSALPNPLNGPSPGASTITITPSGGAVSNAQWSADGGSNWYNSGTDYTAPASSSGSVNIRGRATADACGGAPLTATNEPYVLNYDTYGNDTVVQAASASQTAVDRVTVSAPFAGDKNSNGTVRIRRGTSSGGPYVAIGCEAVGGASPRSCLDSGLADGTYYYEVLFADTDGLGGVANPQEISAQVVAWVDNYLLHNSNRFACSETGFFQNEAECNSAGGTWTYDRKWNVAGNGAEWDTSAANDQYGSIMCSTCHERGSTNIKRIRTNITASSNSFPGSVVSAQVADPTANASDYGDDSDGRGAAGSARICEVCHSQNKYHNYDTGNNVANGGDLLHQNSKDCISCHKHTGGFRASCSACHGNPPEPGKMVTTNPTNSTTPGAHLTHTNTLGYGCGVCHYNSVGGGVTHDSGAATGQISLGFVDLPNPTAPAAQRLTGGSYGTQTAPAVLYDSTDAGTTLVADNSMTCANYCHGSTVGGASPAWGATPASICGTCHGADATTPPAAPASANSHNVHAKTSGTALYQGGANMAQACSNCHGTNGSGSLGHMDGSVQYDVSALAEDYYAAANSGAYDLNAAAAATNAVAPSATYKTCTNLSCHWGAETPVWNSVATVPAGQTDNCTICHNDGTNDGTLRHSAPPSGQHEMHVGASEAYINDCEGCHPASSNTGGHTGHINGNVDFNGTVSGIYSNNETARYKSADDDTCATACHLQANWGASGPLGTGSGINWTPQDDSAACNTTSTVATGQPVVGYCLDCHATDRGYSAGPQIASSATFAGSHLQPKINWTPGCNEDEKNLCLECHAMHDKTQSTTSVLIPIPASANLRTNLGLNFIGDNHLNAINLKKTIPSAAGMGRTQVTANTEAEICWGCHSYNDTLTGSNTGTQSEWNGFAYNGYVLSSMTSNWRTQDFDAAGSRIPNRVTRSIHTANWDEAAGSGDAESDVRNSSVVNNVNGSGILKGNTGNTGTPTLEKVDYIRCSYCHDVHNTHGPDKGQTISSVTTPTYLRGIWLENPYYALSGGTTTAEIPPERTRHTGSNYFTNNNHTGGNWGSITSPRMMAGTTGSQKEGGFFIDQNSNWPTRTGTNTFMTASQTAGICMVCHTEDNAGTAVTVDTMDYYPNTTKILWRFVKPKNGHANSTLDGSGRTDTTHASNIFDADLRDGTDPGKSNVSGYMGGQGIDDTNTNKWGENRRPLPWDNNDKYNSPDKPDNNNNGVPVANSGWYNWTKRYGQANSTRMSGSAQLRGGQYATWYTSTGNAGIGGDGRDNSTRAHNFTCSKCHTPHASGLPALLVTNCLDFTVSNWYQTANGGPRIGPNSGTPSSGSDGNFAWQAMNNCHRKSSTDTGWNSLAPQQ